MKMTTMLGGGLSDAFVTAPVNEVNSTVRAKKSRIGILFYFRWEMNSGVHLRL